MKTITDTPVTMNKPVTTSDVASLLLVGLPCVASGAWDREGGATLLDRLAMIPPGRANRSWLLGNTGGAARAARSTLAAAGGSIGPTAEVLL
jgi:hypothetical protein